MQSPAGQFLIDVERLCGPGILADPLRLCTGLLPVHDELCQLSFSVRALHVHKPRTSALYPASPSRGTWIRTPTATASTSPSRFGSWYVRVRWQCGSKYRDDGGGWGCYGSAMTVVVLCSLVRGARDA